MKLHINLNMRTRTLGIFATAAALSAALFLPLQAHAQDTLEKIKKAGRITIGNGGSYPPFEFVENGNLVGFDIDLGNEIGKRMGVKVVWEKFDFNGLVPALQSKRVDMLATAMTKTPEREQRMKFSVSYYDSGIAAAVRPGVAVTKPEDMAGKIIAVQVGTAGERYAREKAQNTAKEIKTYNEFPLALADVEAGRADLVVNTMPVIKYNSARRGNKLNVVGPWDTRDVGLNTRIDDQALLDTLNKIIGELRAEGFLAQLDAKWFK
jgi:ABC-type amino acid transport substrate-binding protein